MVRSRRSNFLSTRVAGVLAVLGLLVSCETTSSSGGAPAQLANPLAPAELPANDLAELWLLEACDLGDDDSVETALAERAAELEAIFLKAVADGPDDELLADVESGARRRFAQTNEQLKGGETFGLEGDDLEALRGRSEDEVVTRARENFALSYRSQAVLGLGVLATDGAKAALRALAENAESPLQASAAAALAEK